MERAGRLLTQLKSDSIPAENLARTAWPKAVGKIIAAHTRAASMVRDRLVIDVEDVTWQRQLVPLTAQILKKLESLIGPGPVSDIEFRVMPMRMKPKRETVLPLFDANPADDAQPDLPADPIFRHVYLTDRARRASAGA